MFDPFPTIKLYKSKRMLTESCHVTVIMCGMFMFFCMPNITLHYMWRLFIFIKKPEKCL